MLIGIDASRANQNERTGVEWYGYHVISELAKLDSKNRYRLYTWEPLRDGLATLPDNFEEVIVPNRRFWVHTALSWELQRNKVDRLYVPSHVVPLIHPANTTVTIHDLGFRQFKENYSWYHYQHLTYNSKWSARWAKNIIVDSEFVRRDVQDTYGVDPAKLTVIPLGYDRGMFEETTVKSVTDTMAHYRLKDPYLLFIGRLEARKNVARLIEAFYRLTDSGLFGGQLVLAGNPGVGYDEIRTLISKQRKPDQIIQPGYISSESRSALLKGARAFVFPSLYEGFGIPILEAFAAGTPVLTSDRGAPAEVAGDAALLIDPTSVDEIHQGLERLLADQALADRLAAAGLKRSNEYGWDRTAASVHKVLTG